MKPALVWFGLVVTLLACGLADSPVLGSRNTSPPTSSLVPVIFSSPTPTVELSSTPIPLATSTPTTASTPTAMPTFTKEPLPTTVELSPIPTATPAIAAPTETTAPVDPILESPTSEPSPIPGVDFALRYVRLRTNEENSWDGTLGPGQCGSDHSIYVYVADTQENLLDGILVGDRYGNFEVPTGVDGPGKVRVLVWTATMELAIMGHEDGTRYTSEFTPQLSTLDEHIPLDWLEEAGYCDSPEDCQWRVDNNQLCRGHYSYEVIFQRTW